MGLVSIPRVLAAPNDSTIGYSQPGQSKVRMNGPSGVKEQDARLSHTLETTLKFWELLDRTE